MKKKWHEKTFIDIAMKMYKWMAINLLAKQMSVIKPVMEATNWIEF